MTLDLYVNDSPFNVVTKSLTTIESVEVNILNVQDITKPVFMLKTTDDEAYLKVNYLYSEDFGRYYFVKPKTAQGGVLILECDVDVLSSFWAEIKENKAIISKNENSWNLYLADANFKTYQNPYIIQKSFSSGFSTSSMEYVLTVLGGA